MVTGESPSMLFNLVMTRFGGNYNPHIIYDASCLSKEYGYNRELRRFRMLRITTDSTNAIIQPALTLSKALNTKT